MTDVEIVERLQNGVSVPTQTGTLAAGTVFGDWRLTAFLARGGTAEVYCAEHVRLGTPAAVKIGPLERTARFMREAKLLAELTSLAFPRFLGYGEAYGRVYLVEELLEPGDLPSEDRSVADYLCRLCAGLAELHARGIVHRDLKPANILVRSDGAPVIVDLGLSTDDPLGEGAGTPGYAAPEQWMGEEVTPTADVHALGVLANACFGDHPPRVWRAIIRHATSSIAHERYENVGSFARAIRRRHQGRLIVSAIGGFVLLAMCMWGVVEWCESRQPKTIELNQQTVVMREPLFVPAGQTLRVVGPGTMDAVIEGAESATLWMTNCIVLNRAREIFPAVGLKYYLSHRVYLNFSAIDPRSMTNGVERLYIKSSAGGENDVRYHGPETWEELAGQKNLEYFQREFKSWK